MTHICVVVRPRPSTHELFPSLSPVAVFDGFHDLFHFRSTDANLCSGVLSAIAVKESTYALSSPRDRASALRFLRVAKTPVTPSDRPPRLYARLGDTILVHSLSLSTFPLTPHRSITISRAVHNSCSLPSEPAVVSHFALWSHTSYPKA